MPSTNLKTLKQPRLLITLLVSVFLIGCAKEKTEFAAKAPRPVTTIQLEVFAPQSANLVTGSVESWKTEQIGFEVGGKLEWVLEPGKDILPQERDPSGVELRPGTPLAQIDPTQFKVAVKNAEAALEVAKRNQQVAEIRFKDSIPEEIRSAKADAELASEEYERVKRLREQNAVSQSEFDSARTRFEVQKARLTNLQSSKEQADAEVLASKARVRSAELDLENAERDLKHTTLYASFSGQVESVDVVPGSIVSSGSPIMKLQMMNPIKIDIEVSGQQARLLQRNRQVGISYTLADGTTQKDRALLYYVNPSADASTRTFTATFLVINKQSRPPLPDSFKDLKLARTNELWPLNASKVLNRSDGVFMVEENAIETDGERSWVWLPSGIKQGDPLPPVLNVEKKFVTPGLTRIPFLGNWIFRQVTFEDKEVTSENLLVGKLQYPDIALEQWDGKSVFLDSGEQWMLRPGDLVTVDLNSENSEPGFYVPVDSIYEDRGATYVFEVKNGKVTKVPVNVILPDKLDTGSLLRIESASDSPLASGTEIVLGGVHYLNDGDEVRVVESQPASGGQQ